MKIILLKDVPGVGRRYEVKEISPGYARNFILPKGLGEPATEAAMKRVKTLSVQAEAEHKIQEELLRKNVESLDGKRIEVKEKANELGHLFAGIHIKEIEKLFKEKLHAEIPLHFIKLDKPIKEIGTFKIEIDSGSSKAYVTLVVDPA
ncbi:MAG: 50S ribosomal protein L9 [Patescibacteria group bacterium]|mgnify:CR=1 FL=1